MLSMLARAGSLISILDRNVLGFFEMGCFRLSTMRLEFSLRLVMIEYLS